MLMVVTPERRAREHFAASPYYMKEREPWRCVVEVVE